jgi:hypothetical protein
MGHKPHPADATLPAADTAHITCYYEEGRTLETLIPEIFDIMLPNYRILIGNKL